jgi:Calx-beta domain
MRTAGKVLLVLGTAGSIFISTFPAAAATPTISISDSWVLEGNSGTSTANFTVSLSAAPAAGEQVTVQAVTVNRDATAGSDYVGMPPTTLTFGPGEASKQVSITVIGDTAHENNEDFNVELSSPVGGVFGDRTGTGIIADEEGPFFFTQSDTAVTEGNAGTTDATFTVWISSPPEPGEQATVNVQTMNVTATAGSDYVAVPATTLTFGPGETSKQVPVSVLGETVNEANETFFTHLNGETRNANVADSEGTGTIVDDDPFDTAGPTRWVYATNAWVMEGNAGTSNAVFTIYLSSPPAAGQQVTVSARTQDENATAGSDYTAVNTTVVFGPGEISKQVIVPINGDLTGEGLEQFLLNIQVPRNAPAVVADKRGRAFINDEEGPF